MAVQTCHMERERESGRHAGRACWTICLCSMECETSEQLGRRNVVCRPTFTQIYVCPEELWLHLVAATYRRTSIFIAKAYDVQIKFRQLIALPWVPASIRKRIWEYGIVYCLLAALAGGKGRTFAIYSSRVEWERAHAYTPHNIPTKAVR